MIEEPYIIALLASIAGGFIAGIFLVLLARDRSAERKLAYEQQAKRRSEVKRATARIISGSYTDAAHLRLWATDLKLNLNPDDTEDKKIIFYLDRILYDPSDEDAKQKLSELISYWLKFEWDIMQRGASPWPLRKKVHRKRIHKN